MSLIKKILNYCFTNSSLHQVISALIWAVGGFIIVFQFVENSIYTPLIATFVGGFNALFIILVDQKISNNLASHDQKSSLFYVNQLAPRAIGSLGISYFLSLFITMIILSEDISYAKQEHYELNVPQNDRALKQLMHEEIVLKYSLRDSAQTEEQKNKIDSRLKLLSHKLTSLRYKKNNYKEPSDLDALTILFQYYKFLGLLITVLTLIFFYLDFFKLIFIFFKSKRDQINYQNTVIKKQDLELQVSRDQQIQIIDSIQHELGNKLPSTKNYLSDLSNGLFNLTEKGEPFTFQMKVREPLPGEEESEIDSVNDILKKVDSSLNYSISIVDNIKGIVGADPSRFKPEKKSLLTFIQDYVRFQIVKSNFEVKIEGEDFLMDFDPKQLGFLLNNLVANAVRHSFPEKENNYLLAFELKQENANAELFVRNNGAPFEKGFNMEDYVSANKFAGKNGNSGIGGYLVGLIVKNHNGNIELSDREEGSPYNVNIKISLPIEQTI